MCHSVKVPHDGHHSHRVSCSEDVPADPHPAVRRGVQRNADTHLRQLTPAAEAAGLLLVCPEWSDSPPAVKSFMYRPAYFLIFRQVLSRKFTGLRGNDCAAGCYKVGRGLAAQGLHLRRGLPKRGRDTAAHPRHRLVRARWGRHRAVVRSKPSLMVCGAGPSRRSSPSSTRCAAWRPVYHKGGSRGALHGASVVPMRAWHAPPPQVRTENWQKEWYGKMYREGLRRLGGEPRVFLSPLTP